MRRAMGLVGAAAAAALLVQGAAQAQPRAQDVNPTPMPPGSRAGNAPAMNPGPGAAGPANNVPGVRAERVNPTPMPPGSVAGNAPGMQSGAGAASPANPDPAVRAERVNPTPMPPGSVAGNTPGMNPGVGAVGPANNEAGVRAESVNPTPMAPGSVAGNAPGMNPATRGADAPAAAPAPAPAPAPAAGATAPSRAMEGGGAALEEGANSFTAAQAMERMADAGFADIQALALDSQGFWRARAMRNGQPTGVALDYRGHVAATP